MGNREWEKFGEEIRRNVQNAIDSQDYSMLNRTISDTVNGAVDYLSHTMRNVGDSVNENMRMQQEKAARRHQEGSQRIQEEAKHRQQTQGTASPDGGGYRYQGEDYRSAAGSLAYKTGTPALYGMTTPTKIGGATLTVAGYGIGGISVIAMFVVLVVGMLEGNFGVGFWGGVVLTGMPLVIFGSMAVVGTRMLGKVRRFRSYIQALGGREYCDIKELQDQIGKQKKFIVHDLETMIQKGWFKEGHLDSKKTCLMITDKAYQQYTDLMNRVKMEEREQKQKVREQEKKKKEREEAAQGNPNLPPEVREIVQTGEEYIRKIRACNDAIPGEEISAKISRIEVLVDEIFDRVEQSPNIVSDLRRMMEYYLPTTVKLLKAYEDLDRQSVQGENINSSKREIEQTLDTLNVAFEKLLDSLFQDTAWDVSSDISVLHTMLAQEGLTEDGINKQTS